MTSIAGVAISTPATTDSLRVQQLGQEGVETETQQWHELIGLNRFQADTRFEEVTGAGFSTVVIDSGFDLDHPVFGADADRDGVADRIKYSFDFADNDADATDYLGGGHGSFVASIATGGQANGFEGVAPESDIIALKVFGDDGSSRWEYVEAAVEWVVNNADVHSIASVNLSLGAGHFSDPDRIAGLEDLSDSFEQLSKKGVTVVAAAGNDHFKHSTPGVAYPAADQNVIAVGSVWDESRSEPKAWKSGAKDFTAAPDRFVSHSQRHPELTDIVAPGAILAGADAYGGFKTDSGTSFASPIVAGAATLLQDLSSEVLGRRLSPDEFRDLMRETGVTVHDGDDEHDNVINTNADYKRIDIYAMAEAIWAMSPTVLEQASNSSKTLTIGLEDAGSPVEVFVYTTDGKFVSKQKAYGNVSQLTFTDVEPGTYVIKARNWYKDEHGKWQPTGMGNSERYTLIAANSPSKPNILPQRIYSNRLEVQFENGAAPTEFFITSKTTGATIKRKVWKGTTLRVDGIQSGDYLVRARNWYNTDSGWKHTSFGQAQTYSVGTSLVTVTIVPPTSSLTASNPRSAYRSSYQTTYIRYYFVRLSQSQHNVVRSSSPAVPRLNPPAPSTTPSLVDSAFASANQSLLDRI